MPSHMADINFPSPMIPCQHFSNELDLRFFVSTIVCEISCVLGTLLIGDFHNYVTNNLPCLLMVLVNL